MFTSELTVLLTFQHQLANFALGVTQCRKNISEVHPPSEQVPNLHTKGTGPGDTLRIVCTSGKVNLLYFVKTVFGFGDGGLIFLEVL